MASFASDFLLLVALDDGSGNHWLPGGVGGLLQLLATDRRDVAKISR